MGSLVLRRTRWWVFNVGEKELFELFFPLNFGAQQQQFYLWVELFGFGGSLSLEPVDMFLQRVLEQAHIFGEFGSLGYLDHIVVTRSVFEGRVQNLFEIFAHAEQLHAVIPELGSLGLDSRARHVQAVFINNIVVVGFALVEGLGALLQSKPQRILQPI